MLNARQVGPDVLLCHSRERHRLLTKLLCEVQQVFPHVTYELDAESRTLNAQALARGVVKAVRLYGGLALHPFIREDALMFTLLHETGHHLAVGPRFALDQMLACECAADRWALTAGRRQWEHAFGRRLNISRATVELGAVIASVPGKRGSNRKKIKNLTRGCWAVSWQTRSSRMCSARYDHLASRCKN
jgi:hypothetical protein